MPSFERRCCLCNRRAESNKVKIRAQTPSRAPYIHRRHADIDSNDPICGRCDIRERKKARMVQKAERVIVEENSESLDPDLNMEIITNPDDTSVDNNNSHDVDENDSSESSLSPGMSSASTLFSSQNSASSFEGRALDFDLDFEDPIDVRSQSQMESQPDLEMDLNSQVDLSNSHQDSNSAGSNFDSKADLDSEPSNLQDFNSPVNSDSQSNSQPDSQADLPSQNNLSYPQGDLNNFQTDFDSEGDLNARAEANSPDQLSSKDDLSNPSLSPGMSSASTLFSSQDFFTENHSPGFNPEDGMEFSQISNENFSQQSQISGNSHLDSHSLSSFSSQSNSQSSVSSIRSESVSSVISMQGRVGIYLPFKSFNSTNRHCFICHSTGRGSRCRISKIASIDLLCRKKFLVPPNNRACSSHIVNGTFSNDAIKEMNAKEERVFLTQHEITTIILNFIEFSNSIPTNLDFGPRSKFSDTDFQVLLGVTRPNFETIFQSIQSHLNNSSNRTKRNALALFLMKMRLNLSQRVLGILFGFSSQAAVSETLDRVSLLLDEFFVPSRLGYNEIHVTREQIKAEHQSSFANAICELGEENLAFVADGIYLQTQKMRNHEDQRRNYSGQKKYPLVKPMMIVTPTGYIVNADGPFQGTDNDASILNAMLTDKSEDPIGSILEKGDLFILDRGFRDSEKLLKKLGMRSKMPEFLAKKQKQFSTQEANDSRLVTLLRWVVEVVNGRIKSVFCFFDSKIPASYLPKIGRFFRIACAIINAFHPPLFKDKELHGGLAEKILDRAQKSNDLQVIIEDKGLDKKRKCWKEATAYSVPDFPALTMEDLKSITNGVYQIQMAENYCQEHIQNGSFVIFLHEEKPKPKRKRNAPGSNEIEVEPQNLVHAKMQSRFHNRKKHHCWVQFDPEKTGEEGITGWYCRCQVGARTLGCCSHVAALLWFLGYSRNETPQLPHRRRLCDNILSAATRYKSNLQLENEANVCENGRDEEAGDSESGNEECSSSSKDDDDSEYDD